MIAQAGWSRQWLLWLVVILACSLAAKWAAWRFVIGADPLRLLRADSAGYIASGEALLETGRFAINAAHPDQPQTFRTPGYPLFLAAVYRLSGRRDPAVVALAQIALSLATLGLVFWLGVRLWNGAVAAGATLLLALDVPSFAYTLMTMSETLFTLLLLLLLVALAELCYSPERRRLLWALMVGLSLGLATMVRPISYYLIAPLVGALAWLGLRAGWRHQTLLGSLLLLTAPFLLLVAGWQLRNYRLTGNPAFSTVVANNLYYYRAGGIVALRDGVTLEAAQSDLRALQPVLTGKALDDWMRHAALALVRAHPWLAVRSAINGGLTMLLGLGDGWVTALFYPQPTARSAAWDLLRISWPDYWQTWIITRPVAFVAFWLAAAQLIVLYTGNFLWWLKSAGQRWAPIHGLFWLVIIFFVLLSAGPEGNSRLRVPLAPLLALYAAAGFWVWRHKWPIRSTPVPQPR